MKFRKILFLFFLFILPFSVSAKTTSTIIMDNTTGFDFLDNGLSKVEEVAEEYDAYYGSPSPYVVAFSSQKKPVMLCDYSVELD